MLEPTRKRGVNDPSTLDLIFTKSELEIDHLQYFSRLGASDHAILSFSFILEGTVTTESQGAPKFNYWKGDYIGLNQFFVDTDWDTRLANKNAAQGVPCGVC